MTLEMVVPFKYAFADEQPRTAVAVRAQKNLNLVLIENGKRRAREVLTSFGEALAATGIAAQHTVETKSMATPMLAADVERFTDADVVVLGVGDCGGCSSSAALDAIEFRKHGVFAVVIASTPFEYVVSMIAKQNGAPDLPYLLIEHPIWTRDEDWITARSGELATAFAELLTDRATDAPEISVKAS